MLANGYITAPRGGGEAKAEDLVTVQSGKVPSSRGAMPPRLFHRRDPAPARSEVRHRGVVHRRPLDPRHGQSRISGPPPQALRDGLEEYDHATPRSCATRSAISTPPPSISPIRPPGAGALGQQVPRDIPRLAPRRRARLPGRQCRDRHRRHRDNRPPELRRRQNGPGCATMTARAARPASPTVSKPGDVIRSRSSSPTAPTTGPTARSPDPAAHGDGHPDRPRPRHAGRLLLPVERVQPRHPGLRQPGSSFKPFVYAAALDNGYSPATIVLDAPIEIATGAGIWRPEIGTSITVPSRSASGSNSRAILMTVRIAQSVGMDTVAKYAHDFGIYDDMPQLLSYSLGAGETTLYKMVTAYAELANGGLRVEPTLVDRVRTATARPSTATISATATACRARALGRHPADRLAPTRPASWTRSPPTRSPRCSGARPAAAPARARSAR